MHIDTMGSQSSHSVSVVTLSLVVKPACHQYYSLPGPEIGGGNVALARISRELGLAHHEVECLVRFWRAMVLKHRQKVGLFRRSFSIYIYMICNYATTRK